MMDHNESGRLAQERSQGYWLLSQLFLRVPDKAHLLQLQQDLACADEEGDLSVLRDEVAAALTAGDAAAIDFTRRLVIASKASGDPLPYESFVLEGTVPGKATEEVLACVNDAGFNDIAIDVPSPDHIGAEMKFMALLCYEESQAWYAGNRKEVKHLRAMQRHFMTRHLGAWAPDYCETLETRAEHGYMKAVAQLARRCLLADVAALEYLFLGRDEEEGQGGGTELPGDEQQPR